MVLNENYFTKIKSNIKSQTDSDFAGSGFGTGSSSPTSSADTLNNETIRKTRQDHFASGNTIFISGFLNASEQNGNDIWEIGFFDTTGSINTGSMQSWNVFNSSVSKVSNKELWVDCELILDVGQK